jgi:hypothetical protein
MCRSEEDTVGTELARRAALADPRTPQDLSESSATSEALRNPVRADRKQQKHPRPKPGMPPKRHRLADCTHKGHRHRPGDSSTTLEEVEEELCRRN